MAASATFALKAGVWFRRARLLIVAPDSRAHRARRQAEIPLSALCRFPGPALFAFGIQFGNHADDPMPRKIGADAGFDRWDADRYIVQEQTVRASRGETLTLVLISDAKMLDD